MLTEAETSELLRHIEWIDICLKANINRVKQQSQRNEEKLENLVTDKFFLTMWICCLKTLAPKNIISIKMVNVILSSTNPTKLVITF